ncbi:MAG: alpha/beta hydrolase [Candidatus Bathyarchaeota archaeon]|jgi:pimeloyl-ACP methyl ester carboxylesterase
MKETWEHKHLVVDGLRMHYVTQGQGKLLVLLHGFPDFWYVWRYQIPELAKHYRVVAPDLRGYNKTDKPESVEKYQLNLLAGDILGLVNALGEDKVSIIGHDWGGVIAWSLAAFNPEFVEKLVILNAPHPNAYTMKTKLSFKQLQKSWYIFFFQTPNIPEEVLSRNNHHFLRYMVQSSFINKEAITEGDLEAYTKAWSQSGALKAALNYYRANMNPNILFLRKTSIFPKISAPTLVIWGEDDVALSRDLIQNTEQFVIGRYSIKYLPDCGHWVQIEQPKIVNKYISEFLNQV